MIRYMNLDCSLENHMIYLPFEIRNQGVRGVLAARGNLTMNICRGRVLDILSSNLYDEASPYEQS